MTRGRTAVTCPVLGGMDGLTLQMPLSYMCILQQLVRNFCSISVRQRLVFRSVGQSDGHSLCQWSVGPSGGGSNSRRWWSVGRPVGRSVGQFLSRTVGPSAGGSVDQSVTRSVGWLVGLFAVRSICLLAE